MHCVKNSGYSPPSEEPIDLVVGRADAHENNMDTMTCDTMAEGAKCHVRKREEDTFCGCFQGSC